MDSPFWYDVIERLTRRTLSNYHGATSRYELWRIPYYEKSQGAIHGRAMTHLEHTSPRLAAVPRRRVLIRAGIDPAVYYWVSMQAIHLQLEGKHET